jgi:hypothetical protein
MDKLAKVGGFGQPRRSTAWQQSILDDAKRSLRRERLPAQFSWTPVTILIQDCQIPV